MANPIARYTQWLHTMWPAGTVEKLPDAREDGTTAVPGVRIVGDLTGIPLLKFSSDTGARAVQAILAEPDFAGSRGRAEDVFDLAIIGAGVSGVAAAIEAKGAGLKYQIFEATELFSTVANFPKGKPIYTYPTGMTPAGHLQFRSEVHPKEQLLEDLGDDRLAVRLAGGTGRNARRHHRAGGSHAFRRRAIHPARGSRRGTRPRYGGAVSRPLRHRSRTDR